MVEFALGLPVLLLLILGFIEVGRAVMVYNVIANAPREGTRLAITQTGTDPPTWQYDCNVGLVSPAEKSYQGASLLTCLGQPDANVVSTVIEKAVVLAPDQATVTIQYGRPMTGFNRAVPVTVTLTYIHYPLFVQFLRMPVTITMAASSTMYTE